MDGMDSSEAAQSELLVAVERGIGYKGRGSRVLKPKAEGIGKKPYQKPTLRKYGDIRTMTQASANMGRVTDAGLMNKT
jgi:hypothetical protein